MTTVRAPAFAPFPTLLPEPTQGVGGSSRSVVSSSSVHVIEIMFL